MKSVIASWVKRHATLLKALFSVGILTCLVVKLDIVALTRQLGQVNTLYLIPCVGLYLLAQWISSMRWQQFCRQLNLSTVSTQKLYGWYLQGMFYSLFLPGSIGGDVSRILNLSETTGCSKKLASLTVLGERFTGLLAIVGLTLVSGVLLPQEPLLPWLRCLLVGGLMTVLLLGLLLRFRPVHQYPLPATLQPLMTKLSDVFSLLSQPRFLLDTMGYSVFIQILMLMIQALSAQAVGINASLPSLGFAYGWTNLLSILPVSLNGIGVREGALVYFLGKFQISGQFALIYGLYILWVTILTSLSGGVVLGAEMFAKRKSRAGV
jgi:hypothetical protein